MSLVGLIYVAVYAIAAARDQESTTLIESINAELIKIRKLERCDHAGKEGQDRVRANDTRSRNA